jgi:hypothetical protein
LTNKANPEAPENLHVTIVNLSRSWQAASFRNFFDGKGSAS